MAEEPLRILVLANLPPFVMGGAENQVARLVAEWRAAGAVVEVLGHRIPDGCQTMAGYEVRTHHLRTWRSKGRLALGASYLASLLLFVCRNRSRFDVVYCRGLGDGAIGLSIASGLKLSRWPILAVPINAGGAGDASFLRSVPVSNAWRRLLDRQITAINLINEDIADELDALGLTRALRSHIPNGIPVRTPVPRKKVGRPRRLVWTGRMERQKGLDLLIEALAEAGLDGNDVQIDLYGDGPARPALEEQAVRRGFRAFVNFHGALPAEQVRQRLTEADAFVLPSRYEGMSNSALEAMEAGLPVLCTRCGGIDRAVAEGAGWVCVAEDVGALAASFREMASAADAEWLARGLAARKLVEARFRIEDVARSNLLMMRNLLERKE